MLRSELLEGRKIEKVHFIGIDGISMSGLAEILLSLGYKITGSDIKASNRTQKLEKLGARVSTYHSRSNVSDQDLVVYTAAVKQDNPELQQARKLNIPIMDRATLLGKLMKGYPYAVAVAGTHGKTTTTSMLSSILIDSGMDPTVHIGAELGSIGGTIKIGSSGYFVTEACEYCGSFLKSFPYLAVILNIEFDHADYFRDIEHTRDTFLQFARLVPKNGYIVACADDQNTAEIIKQVECKVVTFGINSEAADWQAQSIRYDSSGRASFTAVNRDKAAFQLKLNIPGIHNVYNALAATVAASLLGSGSRDIVRALSGFTGANRRFELKGTVNDVRVIDDYAHHPTEIKTTLKAAKNCGCRRTWCVFQPHTYTRTKSLLEDFSNSFEDADRVIVCDIYSAREKDTGEINSGMLADKIAAKGGNAVYIPKFEEIVKYLEENTAPGDLVITMGAGDIDKVGEMFLAGKKVMAVG